MSLRGRSPWQRPPGQVCSSPEAIPNAGGDCFGGKPPPRNDMKLALQRPRQHQTEDRDDQPDVQKQIAGCENISRQNELDDQIANDQEQSRDGQEALSMCEEFRHEVQES